MGKVHVVDLLRDGHKLWYRIGCGPGMPGPYRLVAVSYTHLDVYKRQAPVKLPT